MSEILAGIPIELLFTLNPRPIMLFDSIGNIQYVNDAFLDMFDFSREEILFKEFREFPLLQGGKGNENETVATQIDKILLGKEVEKLEWTLTKKDGTTIICLGTSIPLRNTNDGATYFLAHFSDVTQERRALQSLRESEERFRDIIENSSEIHFIVGVDNILTYVSPQCKSILGFEPDELLVDWKTQITDNHFNQTGIDLTKKAFETGEKQESYILENHRKDGSLVYLEIDESPKLDSDGKVIELVGVARDVTDRLKAEAAISNSEKKYRNLYESSRNGIAATNIQGTIIEYNQAFKEMIGYSDNEIRRMYYTNLTPEKWHEKDLEILAEQVDVVGYSQPYEKEYIRKDGTVIPVELTTYQSQDDLGNPIGYWSIIRNITEKKRVAEDLRRSEEAYRTLVEQSVQGVLVLQGLPPRPVFCNPSFAEMIGYAFTEILQMSSEELLGIFNENDRKLLLERWEYLLKEEDSLTPISRKLRKSDGTIGWIEGVSRSIIYEGERSIQILTRDVTQEKATENALRASEEKYRILAEESVQGIAIFKDGRILYANQSFADISGYSVDELISRTQQELLLGIHPEDLDRIASEYDDFLSGNETKSHLEYRLIQKNGATRWVESYASPIIYEGESALQIAQLDITERKEAEIAHRISEEKYRILVENSLQGLAIFDEVGVVYVNQSFADSVGKRVEELLKSTTENLWSNIHPGDTDRVMSGYREFVTSDDKASEVEYRYLHYDGSVRWVDVSATKIMYEGKPATQVAQIDKTEKKIAEDALRESEEKYRTLLVHLPQKVFYKNTNSEYVTVNPAFAADYDMNPEEIVGKTEFDLFPKERAEKFIAADKQVIQTGGTIEIEEEYFENGNMKYGHTVKSPVRSENGEIVGVLGVFWDTTDRKLAEQKLRESEERLRNIFQSIPVGMHMYEVNEDKDLIFIDANPASNEILGTDFKDYLGKTIGDAFPPLVDSEIPSRYKEAAIDGIRWDTEEIVYEDQVISGAYEVHAFQTSPGRMVAAFVDITDRKESTRALLESEQRYRMLFEKLSNGVFIADTQGNIVMCNEAGARIFGYSLGECIGTQFIELVHPEDRDVILQSFKAALITGETIKGGFEARGYRRDKTVFHFHVENSILVEDGEIIGYQSLISDITERKIAESALRTSEAMYRGVFDKSPIAICLFNRDGRIIEFNEAFTQTYGISNIEDTVGYNMNKDPHFPEWIFDKLDQGETVELERIYDFSEIRKLGLGRSARKGKVNLYSVTTPLDLENTGIPTHFLTQIQDITERKKAEKELVNAENEWRVTFDAMSDAVSVHDENNRFLRVNQALADIFGYEPEEMIGKYCYELIHKSGSPITQCPQSMMKETKEPVTIEAFEASVGKHFLITTSPILDEKSSIVRTVHVMRDVTNLKAVQQAVEESEERYRTLVSSLHDLVFVFDEEDIYSQVYYNDPSDLVAPAEEIIGKHMSDLLPVEVSVPFMVSSKKVRQEGLSRSFDYSLTWPRRN